MPLPSLRAEFDVDPTLIYLNAGTQSLCPRRVMKAIIRELTDYEKNPTEGLIQSWEKLWRVQTRLAEFLGADPKDLFLRPNVSTVMNDFILGAPLSNGSEILISDTEYTAVVNTCRFRAERDGLQFRSFHLPGRLEEMQGLSEEKLIAKITSELRPETRMMVLSHVMTGNGLTLPLDSISRLTRARGILLVIDGAHGVGALPLDFSRLQNIDYYGGNLHKWTMGPKGTAFGWVNPIRQDSLQPLLAGWTTFEASFPHDQYGQGHRFTQKFLHSACIDFPPFFALEDTFNFWKEIGPERIRARLRALQACVESELHAVPGWKLISPAPGPLRGPLLSYDIPPSLEAQGGRLMTDIYREHRVQVASSKLQGRWVLRISPHIHNTEEEITRAAQVLRNLAKT